MQEEQKVEEDLDPKPMINHFCLECPPDDRYDKIKEILDICKNIHRYKAIIYLEDLPEANKLINKMPKISYYY